MQYTHKVYHDTWVLKTKGLLKTSDYLNYNRQRDAIIRQLKNVTIQGYQNEVK
ncbi:MAG: hypothetical protein KGZ75_04650 [Syntrophomonadaceae bacterium]|nr:hypothetical protein [Syntrophomonadaceae bacterium]